VNEYDWPESSFSQLFWGKNQEVFNRIPAVPDFVYRFDPRGGASGFNVVFGIQNENGD
jgi:hypothetical protein